MATLFSGTALKGVVRSGNLPANRPALYRIFLEIVDVPPNNYRIVGVFRVRRFRASSIGTQPFVFQDVPIRANFQFFTVTLESPTTVIDGWNFIPFYDWNSVIITDNA